MSFGDVLDKKIMTKQEWNLLPNKGIHSCIAPSMYTCKSGSLFLFPSFPQ